ncbi:MAG: cyclic nucleotide-binding domain-containing protein [Magnetospirillum sp.]|nr:cyclic nucleotide-binding domain-containing protein [Magnetospirillum sp.]
MRRNLLGRLYQDGEVVVRIGEPGDSMFQIQKGCLDVVVDEGKDLVVATLGSGDFFGEMSLFTHEPRSATVRSRGESRVLTIDETAFVRRLSEDPMLAYRILEAMFARLRHLNEQGVGYEGYRDLAAEGQP